MSFIALNGIQDVKEQKPAPEGSNYDLVITSAKIHEKDGKQSLECILEIEGEPEFQNLWHYVALPHQSDDEEKRKFKLLMARRFFTQFGIPYEDGVEVEQIVGCRATSCKLVQEEYNGNLSNKLTVNRLPIEG